MSIPIVEPKMLKGVPPYKCTATCSFCDGEETVSSESVEAAMLIFRGLGWHLYETKSEFNGMKDFKFDKLLCPECKYEIDR